MVNRKTKALSLELRKLDRHQSLSMTFVETTNLASELFGPLVVPSRLLLRSTALVAGPYPPDALRPEPGGGDFSIYNGTTDFNVMKAYTPVEIEYMINRAGMSWGYEDPMFVENMNGQTAVNIPAMPYWVIFPSEDVPRQVEKIVEVLRQINWDHPYAVKKLWIDLELHHDQPRTTIMNKTWQMIQMLQDALPGWEIGIYSAAWFLNAFCEFQPWVEQVKWWLAHYLDPKYGTEHPGPPSRPAWLSKDAVWLHQTSSYVDSTIYGAQGDGNKRMDFIRFLKGDSAALRHWLGTGETVPDPSPAPDDHDAIWTQIASMRVISENMMRRLEDLEALRRNMYNILKP